MSALTIAETFQRASIVTVLACFACIMVPAWMSDGFTYSLVSTADCAHSLIVVDLVDCVVCCEPGKVTPGQDGLCIAAYDEIITIFSSVYAYLLPFVPIFISSILYRNHDILKSFLVRGRFLILLLLYRTFFLYKYLDRVEHDYLTVHRKAVHLNSCWYHEYRPCKTKVEFDTSDHIVLFICHYLIPVTIELVVVIACYEHIEPNGDIVDDEDAYLHPKRKHPKKLQVHPKLKSELCLAPGSPDRPRPYRSRTGSKNLHLKVGGTPESTPKVSQLLWIEETTGVPVSPAAPQDEEPLINESVSIDYSDSDDDTQSTSSMASLKIEEAPTEDISSPASSQFRSLDLMVSSYTYLRNIRLAMMVFASLAFMLVSLRAIAYTSAYFHTLAESLAALLQCVVLVVLPLYCFSVFNKQAFYYYVLGIEIVHEY